MAESRRYELAAQLDIEQILLEAQHRWLRPAEICEILRNYQKFRIDSEPPNRPPSGSLILFDRKVLRYFRKDGHNWRKKKDGKTVNEAHEKLKAGSIDVLHCYYAHGEDDENFQRRSYWMLEEQLSHIVLVHYREVKGKRANFNRIGEAGEAIPNIQETEDDVPNSEVNSSSTSKFHLYDYQVTSQFTDSVSLNGAQASEYEDAESAYSRQSSSGFHTFLELQPAGVQEVEGTPSVPYYSVSTSNGYQGQISAVPKIGYTSLPQGVKGQSTTGDGMIYVPEGDLDFPSWGNVLENRNSGYQSVNFQPSLSATQSSSINVMHGGANDILGQVLTDDLGKKPDLDGRAGGPEQGQTSEGDSSYITKWPMDQNLQLQSGHNLTTSFNEVNRVELHNSSDTFDIFKSPLQNDLQVHLLGAASGISAKSAMNGNLSIDGKADYSILRQPLLDGILKEGLKKLDSFDRWMSKELGDVNESHIQSSSGTYWETVGNDDGLDDSNIARQAQIDTFMMSPSISQDQLFSIIDFSPNWAYSGSEMKVLVTGRFLKSQQELEKYKWACMFGELEVPAELVANGILRCHTPLREAGRVPFYVTCSNRLACSEVREFEFQVAIVKDDDIASSSGSVDECRLLMRFGKLITVGFRSYQYVVPSTMGDPSNLISKFESFVIEDNIEWEQMLNFTSEKFSMEKVKDQLLQKLLKDQLHLWLLQKAAEGGKGPNVLDDGGQGVLHLAAALGYDWALHPTIAGGVSVNFRDLNGWTALHWAASYGRERTVAFLVSLGANAGALTDPTPNYPSGRTPADLASSNGHKGIAGYLAESALSSHLSLLKVKDDKDGYNGEISGATAVQTASERTATPIVDGDLLHGLSLKDSLAAVRNATQAAARIHQVFRVQSFQRKQKEEYGDSGLGMSDERALSLLSGNTKRAGQHDEPVHAAATRIQNKFRSWKGRKEFLQIRQRIIKIQAHVRGHQVRKNYRSILWSVGILEKVILRWRRKGSGLRGFKPEAPSDGSSTEGRSAKEDDYDFLKEGRKQTEERLQKALARVKSMGRYPEARDQYRRLLNVVSEMQETKAVYDRALDNSDEAAEFDEDLIDLDALLDDDPLMSLTHGS